jgi:uncharacterized damage-inducible protein DinB
VTQQQGELAMAAAELATSQVDQARDQLARAFERELATTRRVLANFPPEKSELQPHPRLKVARELAWMLVLEQKLCISAIEGTLDMSSAFTPPPASFREVVSAFEAAASEVVASIRGSSENQLRGTVKFFVAPKTVGDVPNIEFLWFILHDHIHHRGQLTVYLRMADGKVPSIYGPSADEPWM